MGLLFGTASTHSAEVMSCVPKLEEAGMCLLEKRCLLEKIHPDVSCITVVCEFEQQ